MMKSISKQLLCATAILLLVGSLFVGGCANTNPIVPQSPPAAPSPAAQPSQTNDITVMYNYSDTSKVQLSANNISLTVGQKLILQPAPGLTIVTRFTSSGDSFFGDVMKQEVDPKDTSKVVFTAIKPGKGRLQVIPNTSDTDRAVDLLVTVQ